MVQTIKIASKITNKIMKNKPYVTISKSMQQKIKQCNMIERIMQQEYNEFLFVQYNFAYIKI
jgi:hypothetical protein